MTGIKAFVLLLFVGYAPGVARAGDVVRNGGDVVICGESVRLLDYYEAEAEGEALDLPSDNDPLEVARAVLYALRSVDFDRAERYLGWIEGFAGERAEVRFVEESLPDIYDAGRIVQVPEGCTIRQVALQMEPSNGDVIRYLIDRRLWERLSIDDRAGLVLHEIVLREARLASSPDTRTTRALNVLLARHAGAALTRGAYQDEVRALGFNIEAETEKLRSVADFFDRYLAAVTLTRDTRNQMRDQGRLVADVIRRTRYRNVQTIGRRLYLTNEDEISSRVWRVEGGERIGEPTVTQRVVKSRLVVTHLRSVDVLRVTESVLADSDSSSTRSTASGTLRFSEAGALVYEFMTDGFSDYRTAEGLVPGRSRGVSTYQLVDGLIEKRSEVTVERVDPETLAAVGIISRYDVTSRPIGSGPGL
jgi:hypothetical protein